jgi:hypothetical protein
LGFACANRFAVSVNDSRNSINLRSDISSSRQVMESNRASGLGRGMIIVLFWKIHLFKCHAKKSAA